MIAALGQELDLKKKIKEVLAFFDLFDYPLTPLEIWHYLDKKFSFKEILFLLDSMDDVCKEQGLIFLSGRNSIINVRKKRYNYTKRKLKKAKHFSFLFSLCPFVQLILLGNSLGSYNLRDGSDIDFVIISKPRRLWLTRLYCAGLAAILNSRPKKGDKRDKICLSFYISSDSLNLDNLQLKPEDPYFFYWLRSLVVLYNKNKTYERFLQDNKLFFNDKIRFDLKNKEKKNLLVYKFFNILEDLAKNFQLLIMAAELKMAANNSVGVVINNKVLKLYLRDNRQEYLEKYGNKLQQISA